MICEVCANTLNPQLSIDLGSHALCDDLVKVGNKLNNLKYKQEIIICNECLTAHQMHPVPKEILFKEDCHYRASLTQDVINGMQDLVNKSLDYIHRRDSKMPIFLDVGCNDGSLLKEFKSKMECFTIGVDPTDAILENNGVINHSIQGYFNIKIAENIVEKFGKPDLITFTNVFAHIEDLDSVLKALKILISNETIIIIENHYLGSIFKQYQFDTFYHEHPRTYSLKSFEFIASKLDLEILDVNFPRRYGGNIRVILGHVQRKVKLEKVIKTESNFVEKFLKMQEVYDNWKAESIYALDKIIGEDKIIFGKSLPGRAVMLISSLGLNNATMPYVFEQPSSPKIGHYVPGTQIEIVSDSQMKEVNPKSLILWSWHIADEVVEYFKNIDFQGKIWRPIPEFKLIKN